MQIFEQLLYQALRQQAFSLKNLDSDLYGSQNMVTRSNTKSFKDLCQKILYQNKCIIDKLNTEDVIGTI